MSKLTARQKKFADEYSITGVAETSALNAGYSETYARAQSHKLLAIVGMKEYLEERNKALDADKIADMKEVREFWTDMLRDDMNEPKDRIKVSELIGKANGAFLDRVEQTGDMGITIEWIDDE